MANGLSPIRSWHIVLSGFLQREGSPNGMVRLYSHLHAEHAGPDCMVELRTWNDSMASLAEKIWLLRPANMPVVKIYGYSWGGANAIVLANELGKRSIGVKSMVLSDAVYRHRYRLGSWRALWPFSTLWVPPNVVSVWWYRQTKNLPSGHEVVAVDPKRTWISNGAIIENTTHQYMDDSPEFHRTAMEVARGS